MTNIHLPSSPIDTPPDPPALHMLQAAEALQKINEAFAAGPPAGGALAVLRHHSENEPGQDFLLEQTHILNSLFHRLTLKALSMKNLIGQPIPDYVNDDLIKLALSTQKQCRITIEAMHVLQKQTNELKDAQND